MMRDMPPGHLLLSLQSGKKACTILMHKKGETDDPANFRPITLETIPLKVFTSCLRNRTFQFLAKTKYIEQAIQKRFYSKTFRNSGTYCADGTYN